MAQGEKPIRWVTVRGKRVPVTAPKGRKRGASVLNSDMPVRSDRPDLVETVQSLYETVSRTFGMRFVPGVWYLDDRKSFHEKALDLGILVESVPRRGMYFADRNEILVTGPRGWLDWTPRQATAASFYAVTHELIHASDAGREIRERYKKSEVEAFTEFLTRRFLADTHPEWLSVAGITAGLHGGAYSNELMALVEVLLKDSGGDEEQAVRLADEFYEDMSKRGFSDKVRELSGPEWLQPSISLPEMPAKLIRRILYGPHWEETLQKPRRREGEPPPS